MIRLNILWVLLFSVLSCSVNASEFTLTSHSISEGKQLNNNFVYKGFGCDGGNQSPSLSWSGAPEGTKSYVITAYDPDAPTGSGWWHWVVFNIPVSVTGLDAGASHTDAMPKSAIEVKTDFGSKGFGGACPPPGKVHRYQFTVYALDTEKLELTSESSPALVGFMTKSHALASDTITAVYTR